VAYMDQAGKAKIAAALKAVMPNDVKYTLSVRDHSTICMTIKSASVDFIGIRNAKAKAEAERCGRDFYEAKGYHNVNHFYLDTAFDGKALEILEAAKKALYSADYFDDSDIQSDYFSCAYYIDIQIGTYDKPFVVTA
jgi:hypothetical protein